MYLSSLAHRVMLIAAEHNVQAEQVLPERAFDLFLTEEGAWDALMELYLDGLLEEVPHEVDILTKKGFEYIQRYCAVLEA
ncbi:hypothetical protein [Raoultella ornithinolytica]|uniref:hypothetical protein n=1 Tax=Raoultella ornithinolytica TaxID=54291 RepID=UPI001265D177|nr:hypothetical protein [Raoultella ornithinolytica]KAB8156979.1 hypothetical protein FNV36_18640 [Raoultella ornithinolytica]KAB8166187.1 hypothetical protein FNV35_18495 [Raoultella ornithinolytica]QWU10965.1 hypothetical protein KP007_03630 [Raoultella ornithinolytica]